MNDLLKQQAELRKEAREVVEKLDLMNFLGKYGKPYLVGSIETGLMTWRDIDLEVIVEGINKDLIAEMVISLIKAAGRRLDISIVDNRDAEDFGKGPVGYYLGLKYYDPKIPKKDLVASNKNAWKIDIWFVLEKDARSHQSTQDLLQQLNDQNRQIILEIKNQIMDNPKYRYEFFSTDIYKAVLENQVTNLEEFKDYLKKIGKNLN